MLGSHIESVVFSETYCVSSFAIPVKFVWTSASFMFLFLCMQWLVVQGIEFWVFLLFFEFCPVFQKPLFEIFRFYVYAVCCMLLWRVCLLFPCFFVCLFIIYVFLSFAVANLIIVLDSSFSLYPLSGSLLVKNYVFLSKSALLLQVRTYLKISLVTKPLNVVVGWYDSLWRYWDVSVFLVSVLTLRVCCCVVSSSWTFENLNVEECKWLLWDSIENLNVGRV